MKSTSYPLKDITTVTSGQSAPQGSEYFATHGFPFVRAGSLEFLTNGESENKCEKINEKVARKFRLRLFSTDTILFAKSGMSAKIGRVYRLKKPCYVVSHLAAIIPGPKVVPSYLQRWFEKFPPSRLIPNEAYPSIRISEIERLRILLPPLPEQKRIAAILDKADAIRRKRQAAIKLADDFLHATFFDMFGDPVTNPKGWEEKSLNEIADIVSGVTKGRKFNVKKTIYIPYMRVANIQDGHIDLTEIKEIEALETDLEKYSLRHGDILLTEGGDPDKLGRGAVWREEVSPCIHQNHIFRVRVDKSKASPEYLSNLIGSARGKRYFLRAAKQTTGIASINMTQLKGFPVLLPPLELQKKYVDFVEKYENHLNSSDEITHLNNDLFNSLTQRAFRGEL